LKVPPEILSFLKKDDRFFIATHINPEGDALGSSIALSLALETMGKTTIVFDRDSVPEYYRFLPGNERVVSSVSELPTMDLNLVLLDCNVPERAGIDGLQFRNTMVIDHHETEKDFGDIKWVIPDAAATGMMIFYLIKELGMKITREIAVNLYAALAIDTGTFRYANTSSEVLKVAAELLESGANPAFISTNLYETWSEKRFRLFIMALNTLEIREGVAFTSVTRGMFRETATTAEDTENFSGFPRMMKDVKISAFFRETDEAHWKVSLRSKGDINVAFFASSFGGGGHKNAAGYMIRAPLKTAQENLLGEIRKSGGISA
jgi:bifunctional oligoribonuclease and PAP phosphatase NrnA